MKKRVLLTLLLGGLAYLFLWPVPFDPVAWTPSETYGYTGAFAPNDALAGMERVPTEHGPEDIAERDGVLYVSSGDGQILRVDPVARTTSTYADTGGRPLGIEFDRAGNLWVADAYRGLLKIDPEKRTEVVCAEVDGSPIRYADDVDVARDGRVFFSDASVNHGAEASGGTLVGAFRAVLEHGSDGRLLVYDGACRVLVDGLDFANGVALSADEGFVAVVETTSYRVSKYHLTGPHAGQIRPFVAGLPGFPDNISRAPDGGFWIGLFAPRSPVVEATAAWPFVRAVIWRLPEAVRPKPKRYGHLIKVDANGNIMANLQDPSGAYPMTTGALELGDRLYVTSLTAPALGMLPAP